MEIKFINVLFCPRKGILKNIMRVFVILFCTSVFSFTPTGVFSQKIEVSIDENKMLAVDQVFDLIRSQTECTFIYQEDMFQDLPNVNLSKGEITVKKLLELSLGNEDFTVNLTETNEIIISRKLQQQNVVKGVVKDEEGLPLLGVTVMVKGTTIGVTTDFDGQYTINASKGDVLQFSYVGMTSVELTVENEQNIDVVLKAKVDSFDEVVIVGYGTQSRKDITGSVSKINIDEISKVNSVSVDNALVGQAAGVHVITASGAPGANASIRIRGITSVFGNNEPLYVVDGLPIELGQGQGNDFYTENYSSSLSPLSSINPMDIESIDILKDASATAIYGSRGANGVVIITTKKGSYSSVPNISFTSTTSVSSFTNDYSMLSANQYHNIVESAYRNADLSIPSDENLYPFGSNMNTDWQKETEQIAIHSNYYLNANGGSLDGSSLYSISAGVTDQKGAIYGTKYSRNNLRAKLETGLSDDLRIGVNFNYSDSENRGSSSSFYYQTIQYRPDVPIYNEDGSYANDPSDFSSNPYSKVRYPSFVDNQNLILSLFAEYRIAEGLLFKSTYSYTKGDNKNFRYTPSYDPFELRNNRKGTLNQSESSFSSRIWDNILTYNKSINKHDLNAITGVSYTENNSEFNSIRATDFPDDDVMVTPGAASSLNLTTGGTISGLASYLLSLNYNYDSKYYLTFTGRADNSTKFGPKNQWGYFPSGAVAWRISKEDFFDVNIINDLRLRTSYGKTGSANFSDFQYATFFNAGSYYNNNNGVVSNTIPNPDIKWETTNQLDIALDFSMWDNRINGNIGYFNKKTSDQILLRDVILETGGTSQYSNIGDFLNKGFEFQIGVDIISKEKFQWTSEFNITAIKSKVLSLNGGYYRNLIEGESISYFSGYKMDGIFQNQAEIDALNAASPNGVYQSQNTAPGDFKYVDINNDGFIGSDDRDIIGNAEPDFFGGFNNIFRFGNLTVSTLFNFSIGNYLYNNNKKDLLIFGNYESNYSSGILNAWTPENTDTDIPRLVAGDPNNNRRESDFFIEDASFIKLKNLNITYNVNPEHLNKTFIERASVSLSASNVFVITKYSGLDPEVNYNAAGNFNQGYDSASYPAVRTFTLGLNLNL